ncbi:hypothetical protein IJ098_01290 [Candidatus Saccharibacteria bacterium]|nr:hypothetical protein [Candidatus Saccharibacteria bacterium]
MSETISSRGGETSGESNTGGKNAWDGLKEVPFRGGEQQTNHEADKPKYETELNSPDDILNDVNKFTIKNGIVYSRETGQVETDEDTILRAKTSRFLFNEARALRDADANANGDKFNDRGPAFYIDKAMDRFAIKDEENSYGTNKLINELIRTGRHEGTTPSDGLTDSKFSMFDGEKADYGKALLKRKFRQRGVDMGDFNITLDNSEFQHTGHSNVSIEITTKPLVRKTETIQQGAEKENALHHPASEQLKQLEQGLLEARKSGDEDAIRGYQEALKRTISENPLEVSPEEWDSMDDGQKIRFYELKMKEARTLGDRDAFDFWNANLKRLNSDK